MAVAESVFMALCADRADIMAVAAIASEMLTSC
jgi:hypothetical protein